MAVQLTSTLQGVTDFYVSIKRVAKLTYCIEIPKDQLLIRIEKTKFQLLLKYRGTPKFQLRHPIREMEPPESAKHKNMRDTLASIAESHGWKLLSHVEGKEKIKLRDGKLQEIIRIPFKELPFSEIEIKSIPYEK